MEVAPWFDPKIENGKVRKRDGPSKREQPQCYLGRSEEETKEGETKNSWALLGRLKKIKNPTGEKRDKRKTAVRLLLKRRDKKQKRLIRKIQKEERGGGREKGGIWGAAR